jgi:Domain of unknown function (DUF4382)
MSRPLAIPVMIVLLILACALEPASTPGFVPPLAAAAAAFPHALTSRAMPLANSILSSEPAGGLLYLRVRQRPIEGASSIQVTVKNIQVQKAEAPKGLDWITVIKGEKTFELVGSEQGEGVIGGKMLAEGLYSRVQMDLVSVTVTQKGQQKPAKVASKRLREIRPFDIDMTRVCILTLDFDVAKSLIVAESGEIQFKPVVRLIVKRGSPG